MFSIRKKMFEPAVQYPKEEWYWKQDHATKFTPDIWKISQYEFMLMFICDELQMGLNKHHLMGAELGHSIAKGFTAQPFWLWKKKLGKESFAIPLQYKDSSHLTNGLGESAYSKVLPRPLPIKGEIYRVRWQKIVELDNHKENGLQFVRKRVHIDVPYFRAKLSKERNVFETIYDRPIRYIKNGYVLLPQEAVTISAWMYVGIPDEWVPELDAGWNFSPVQTFSPKHPITLIKRPSIEKYYWFTFKEYDDI